MTAPSPSRKTDLQPSVLQEVACDLRCAHCQGKLLEAMIPAQDPETFLRVVDQLRSNGAHGILVSGGADRNGEVPLDRFILSIGAIKEKHPLLKIIVHTGLIRREPARKLKEAGVDQILIDVIGDDDTIREVYHFNKTVADYEETLWMLKEMGHRLAPHIIIGHHFGEIRGEWKALELVTRVGVETIVLVVFKTLNASEKNHFKIPEPRRNFKNLCHRPYSQPKHSHSNGLYPARPFLESSDGERGDRLRDQYHRLSAPRNDRLCKRNWS